MKPYLYLLNALLIINYNTNAAVLENTKQEYVDPFANSSPEKIKDFVILCLNKFNEHFHADITDLIISSAMLNSLVLIKFFVESGENINASDSKGLTALHIACKTGNIAILEYLIAHEANVNAKDNLGQTPIYYLLKNIKNKSYSNILVSILVKAGANIDHLDKNDLSVLHNAIHDQNIDLVKALVENGANVNILKPDNSGISPLAFAMQLKVNNEIIEYLKSNGATSCSYFDSLSIYCMYPKYFQDFLKIKI